MQMNGVALHAVEAGGADGIEEPRGGAVIEDLRRWLGRVLKVHFHRMSLAGADALAIFAKGEALFVTGGDDVFEVVQRQSDAVLIDGAQQFVNADPTSFVQLEADLLGFVAEDQAEEFAGFDGLFVGHIGRIRKGETIGETHGQARLRGRAYFAQSSPAKSSEPHPAVAGFAFV